MADLWQTRDWLGRVVALTEERWSHILGEHSDVVHDPQMVREAIERPDFVNRDASIPHRLVHYRQLRTGTTGLRLKVVIHYSPVPPQGTWVGRVITAYGTDLVPSKEQRLWP